MSLRNLSGMWSSALAACVTLAAAQFAAAQVNENFDSTPLGSLPAGWTSAVTGGGTNWVVANSSANSGANSVFTPDNATTSEAKLTLPAVVATASGPMTLDFWRRIDAEGTTPATAFDGLRVYVSVNGGAFTALDPRSWTRNGYTNNSITASIQSVTATPGFSGQFPIWTRSTTTVFATSGDTIQFQVNFSSDGSIGRGGFWIDDVTVDTGVVGGSCCNSTGICQIRTAADCIGGAFTAGSSCTSAPCAVIANDVCAGAVAISLMTPVLGSDFGCNNDYQITATTPPFNGLVQTTTTAPGRDSVYTFTPASSGNYSFRLSYNTISTMSMNGASTAQNMALYVANVCPAGAPPITIPTANIIGASNRNTLTLNGSEEIHCVALTGGTQYWVYVDSLLTTTVGGMFYLEVFECANVEVEANDTPATANTFVFGNSGMEGSINVNGDVDFYSLGTPVAGSRVFALVDANASSSNAVIIKTTTTTDTLQADTGHADGIFGTASSVVAGTPLTGVASFLRVSGSSATTLYQPYRLYAAVQPPIASAIPETEPNDTLAQANSASSNYFSGSISTNADTDTYSFVVAAGAMIFAALDCDPLRDNTPFNGALEIWDANGLLEFVNDLAPNTAATSSITTGAGSLTSTTPNSPGEALVWRARTTGTYYIRVRTGSVQPNTAAVTPATPTGDYLLSITLVNNNLGDGACCNTSGGCTVLAGTSCLSPSLFQGAGSSCSGGLCPVTVGACCLSNGGCTYTFATSCNSPSFFQGSNATCGATPCPAAGSCCSGASCALTLSTTCAGTFTTGGGCGTNLCAAACCDSSNACVLVPAAGPCSGTIGAPGSVCVAVVCGPANDSCAGATVLTAPTGVTAQTIDARGAGPDVGLSCNTAGFTSSTLAGVWYKIVIPAGDDYTMTFGESATTDSIWGLFSGTCAGLTPVACFAGDTANTVPVSAGQTYYLLLGVQGTTVQPTLNPTYNVTISFTVATGACCNGSSCSVVAATACTGAYLGVNSSCVGGPNATDNVSGAIPDGVSGPPTVPGVLTKTLAVSGVSGPITSFQLTMNITHTWVGDLIAKVQGPTGVTAVLFSRPSQLTDCTVGGAAATGNSSNNFLGVYTFADSGVQSIADNATTTDSTRNIPAGTYKAADCANAAQVLNTIFASETPNGTWTLTISDLAGADTGTVASWSLTINGGTAPPCSVVGSCCVGSTCSIVANAAACSGAFTLSNTSCSPNPCAPAGVCCRGATCTTAFTSAGACAAAVDTVAPATVLSKFVTGTGTCNTPVTVPGTLGNVTSPCCFANYNHNATLEVQDIFDFLNDWFAGKKAAIVGGDGSTGSLQVQNIFDFLNSWFAGGCN